MLCKVTHRAGSVSANTRPHQLRWGDWEMGTAMHYHSSSIAWREPSGPSCSYAVHSFAHFAPEIYVCCILLTFSHFDPCPILWLCTLVLYMYYIVIVYTYIVHVLYCDCVHLYCTSCAGKTTTQRGVIMTGQVHMLLAEARPQVRPSLMLSETRRHPRQPVPSPATEECQVITR